MIVELFDMDVPYSLKLDCNDEGVDFIRIESDDSGQKDICLDYDGAQELIRVLQFMVKEIKPKKK